MDVHTAAVTQAAQKAAAAYGNRAPGLVGSNSSAMGMILQCHAVAGQEEGWRVAGWRHAARASAWEPRGRMAVAVIDTEPY